MPPDRELAERFGVSRATVREATNLLEREDLVKKKVGLGGTLINSFEDRLHTNAFTRDPHQVLDQLRAEEPIYWSEGLKAWVLTRYADVKAAGRNPHLGGGRDRARGYLRKMTPQQQAELAPLCEVYSRFLSFMNPPEHTAQRGLLSDEFTPQAVQRMRARIDSIVNRLLDELTPTGQADLLHEFALPMSSSVIVNMLGLPEEDRERFIAWIDNAFEFLGSDQTDFELAGRAMRTYEEMTAYLRGILEERRARPRNDLISKLAGVQKNDSSIPDERIIAAMITIVHGGWETTTTMVTNAMVDLLTHSDQLQKLKRDPSLLTVALEEALRFDGPFKYITRSAMEDFDLCGRSIRKGETLMLMLCAANRDPEVFEDPHRFEIGRKRIPHVAFGVGIHFCLGATLARIEGELAIAALLRRLPQMRLATEEPLWRPTSLLRQLEALPVVF